MIIEIAFGLGLTYGLLGGVIATLFVVGTLWPLPRRRRRKAGP